jgi:hypothetical protein
LSPCYSVLSLLSAYIAIEILAEVAPTQKFAAV